MQKTEKIMLILSGVKGGGKTETLRMFFNTINSKYTASPVSIPATGDFSIEIDTNIRGNVEKMGITSFKDVLEVDKLIKKDCTIVICESLMEGNSELLNLVDLGEKYNYLVLQDKAYRTTLHNASHYTHINSIKSEHIIDLLTKI